MCDEDPTTKELLDRAGRGDQAARDELLVRHRDRLRRMVAVRMDRRLTARVDPSDVVQEALLEAARRLCDYLQRRPATFYIWLRQLAWQHLSALTRRHVGAQRRSVNNELAGMFPLSDESMVELARHLVASDTGPTEHARRDEMQSRVRTALGRLATDDREVLVLRYLEQLSTREVAAVLQVSERTVRSRHRRALECLGELLGGPHSEERRI